MSRYKIYLTRSNEVALLIKDALAKKIGDNIISVSQGPAGEQSYIPAIYQNKGYFYAMVEYADEVGYEIIFA